MRTKEELDEQEGILRPRIETLRQLLEMSIKLLEKVQVEKLQLYQLEKQRKRACDGLA